MISWIALFGFILSMRAARSGSVRRPEEGLRQIALGALDLFLSMSLAIMLGAALVAFGSVRSWAQEYEMLIQGGVLYFLSHYQKKPAAFFLVSLSLAFLVGSRQSDPLREMALALAVSAGVMVFQVFFLGLRYRILFSRVPVSMKGWPLLCLLASLIALILEGLGRWVF